MGFMGSGKTTLGRMLAQEWQLDFYDLDVFIVNKAELTIPEIFSIYGEKEFRKIESEALRELVQGHPDGILSMGGGTPCFHQNMDFIKANTQSIYLRLSPAELSNRLLRSPNPRPLVQNKSPEQLHSYIETELLKREEFYMQADQIIESDSIQLSDLLTFVTRP